MLHFLPRDERYRYDRQCDALLGDAMAALLAAEGSVDAREWRVIGRREQLTVHRAARAEPAADGSGPRLNVLARGFLAGTLNQIAEGLSAETDEELLTSQALVSGSKVAVTGAAVLNVAEHATPRAKFRFAGVKWCSWTRESHEGEQDLLTYERMGMTHDNEDREVAYHVVRSIDRPEWPLFVARPPGLRRADLALCFVFRAVADDLVECFVTGSYHARGSSATQRTADIAIAERVLTVTRALRAYEAKKISHLIDKARDRQVAMAKSCLRCGARRTVLDPHRNCAICKKSVCTHCRQVKHVFKTNMNTRLPESEPICNVCLKRAHLPSAIGSQHHTHSSQYRSSSHHRSEPRTPEPRERASLPSDLEYKNYDRLLQTFAQRRTRSSSELPLVSSSSGSSNKVEDVSSGDRVEVNSSDSKSDDHSSGEMPKKALAISIDQLVELRRERETVLSFPIARTVVEQELYLAPADDENTNANANANEAEKIFRLHRERQKQLEEFERPNPLHQRMLEEQQRRREYNALLANKPSVSKDTTPEINAAPEDSSQCEDPPVTRRRAATVPNDVSSREDERFQRATSTLPYLMPSSRATSDSFRSDLYARF